MSLPHIRARHGIYDATLAQIHAEAYTDTFAQAWPWLASQIREASDQPYLFDIGCGDGSWLLQAKSMNIAGQGIDISAHFVKMAQENGANATQDSADQAVPPPALTAATALGEVLAYKPATLAPTIRNLARALPSGGLVFFDLPGPDTPERDNERAGKGWRMSVQTRKSDSTLLVRKIMIETRSGREMEMHEQMLFRPEDALGIVQGLGLNGEIMDSYGPCPLLRGRYAIRAVKP